MNVGDCTNYLFFLAQYDPEVPTFFGGHFKVIVDQGYMSGGSGYILSR